MSEFVDECRREWRRLGVADPVANEMAADLTADIEQAEAEGGSAEDVLGNSAFDPRRFAASWATARGVTGPPSPDRRPLWRPSVAAVLTVILGALVVLAGLAVLVRSGSSSIAVATRRIVAGPGAIRLFGPGPGRIVIPGPLGRPIIGMQIAGHGHAFSLLLLLVAVVGILCLGLAALYWSPWFGPRRLRRHQGPRTPGWN